MLPILWATTKQQTKKINIICLPFQYETVLPASHGILMYNTQFVFRHYLPTSSLDRVLWTAGCDGGANRGSVEELRRRATGTHRRF